MKRKVSVLAVLSAALCTARVSLAQDAPATATAPSAPASASPTPPQGYPPPPPRYPQQQPGYQYPQYPPTYYAPAQQRRGWGYYPQHEGVYRPFSFSIGVGPGYLHGWGTDADGKADAESDVALSYNLFRLGFGVVPNVSFILEFQGMGASTRTKDIYNEASWLRQENWLLGIQYHFLQRMYLRGGFGAGFISESSNTAEFSGGTGMAMSGAIGWEFVQTPHVALALDANGSVTKYSNQYWSTAGLNLAVSFF